MVSYDSIVVGATLSGVIFGAAVVSWVEGLSVEEFERNFLSILSVLLIAVMTGDPVITLIVILGVWVVYFGKEKGYKKILSLLFWLSIAFVLFSIESPVRIVLYKYIFIFILIAILLFFLYIVNPFTGGRHVFHTRKIIEMVLSLILVSMPFLYAYFVVYYNEPYFIFLYSAVVSCMYFFRNIAYKAVVSVMSFFVLMISVHPSFYNHRLFAFIVVIVLVILILYKKGLLEADSEETVKASPWKMVLVFGVLFFVVGYNVFHGGAPVVKIVQDGSTVVPRLVTSIDHPETLVYTATDGSYTTCIVVERGVLYLPLPVFKNEYFVFVTVTPDVTGNKKFLVLVGDDGGAVVSVNGGVISISQNFVWTGYSDISCPGRKRGASG